jgi:hypothetical protein
MTSRLIFKIATLRAILDSLANLLGDDIVLRSACVIQRAPEQRHP